MYLAYFSSYILHIKR